MTSAGTFNVRQRQLMKHATMTVTIKNPAHDRFMTWIGLRLVAAGAWFMGFGRTEMDLTSDSDLSHDDIQRMVDEHQRREKER